MKPLICLAAVLGLATPLHAAFAQGMPENRDPNATQWGLGLGVGVENRAYEGADRKVRALPILFFENRYVRFAGLGLDLKLPEVGPVSFALSTRYQGDGYESGDAPILAGMADRKGGVLLGGSMRWHAPEFDLQAELLRDVSGHSEGLQAKLMLTREFRAGRFMFTPGVGATWLDKKQVDYYYGVTAEEALANRPQYDGKGTVNLDLNLRTSYLLAPHQILTLDLGGTHLGSGITDSPLVGRDNIARARFGYLYRF
ncbi:MAG TPA: MipA/OmpV family protein [Ideonella sp.]|uniref:MipA/OmpV family protein n=1 Tax=Ideonella sp. TaxID=1929293 RepID=UPI002BF9BA40|nr:MipA/OmpV family protein [Ideonella sp.]HSI50256.1 MipA/OmpV family protein [Ideonella sp.]